MARIRNLERSFGGGELSPEMFGRIDDTKYQSGLALCRNFITKPQGSVENRPGFAFVREVKDSTKAVRIIPFTYSTTQTMVIELGEGYIRFHTQGATLLSAGLPYEIASPYLQADLFDIHYVQSADILTLVHPNHAPMELKRLGAINWTLTAIAFTPTIQPPTGTTATSSTSGTEYQYRYVITALAADNITESAKSVPAVGVAIAITAISQANPGAVTAAAHGFAVGDPVYVAGVAGMIEINDREYLVNSVIDINTITLSTPAGVPVDTTAYGAYTSGGTVAPAFIVNNLFVTGAKNTINWQASAGAVKYNIYKEIGGLFGYIGESAGLSFVDDNISPDMAIVPPLYDLVFGAAGDYPGAVSYFEQRRSFGGTNNKLQNIWMTRSGTESNMSYSLPVRSDDRISFRIAAREANTIRHIVPLSQLILLTSSAEWRVSSTNSGAITPSSISVRPQSYVGASNVQPVIINNSLLYCAARGGHVREMGYNWQANGFVTGDMSLRSTHLFDNLDIVDMAYSKAPQPIVWFVSTSGKLLGLTYVPEQQIGAWHQHDTIGTFESCCIVAEGNEDVLYVVVKRTINGNQVRYVERMGTRLFVNQSDAFFVDSGMTYSGAAATIITGLNHLEGETVSILADGAVHPQLVVTGGSITLNHAASLVHIGLPITADLQTLPVAAQIDGSFGQGRVKNVNKAWLRVYRSSGIFVGPDAANLTEAKQRSIEPLGSPPALKTEEIELMITPSWSDGGQVYIRQADPLPLTVVNLSLEIALGG